MFYDKVFRALNKAKVKYVVAGGVAVVLHGYYRFTQDLDLIVFMQEGNLDRLLDAFHKIGYVPKLPIDKNQLKDKKQRAKWKKEKSMIVFPFCNKKPPFEIVDIFIHEPLPFKEIYSKKIKVKVNDIMVPVLNIDHLIKIKNASGRNIDLNDLEQLKEIKRISK